MLLQFIHVNQWRFVIHLQDPDKVGDGKHADKLLFLTVPQWSGADPCIKKPKSARISQHNQEERKSQYTVVDKGEEGFLHQELSVEDDQFGAGRNEIVTLVEPEEFDEYLVLILCKKKKKTVKKRVRIEENRSCSIQNKNIPKNEQVFSAVMLPDRGRGEF